VLVARFTETVHTLAGVAWDDPMGRFDALGDAMTTWAQRYFPQQALEPADVQHVEQPTREGPELGIDL
jgi:hypothetical protein